MDVPHPEFAFLFPGGRKLIVVTPRHQLLYERIVVATIVWILPLGDAEADARAA